VSIFIIVESKTFEKHIFSRITEIESQQSGKSFSSSS